jgi:hypothetical protein
VGPGSVNHGHTGNEVCNHQQENPKPDMAHEGGPTFSATRKTALRARGLA